jgi:hypothetical protein
LIETKKPCLKELNWLKQQARKEGYKGKILENIPFYYQPGQYAEIAILGLLGATQAYLKEKGIHFWIEATAELDRLGVDVRINKEEVQLKSKYSYQLFMDINPDLCYIEYDAVGMENLYAILKFIGFPKFYASEEFKAKINKMWRTYMKKFDIVE